MPASSKYTAKFRTFEMEGILTPRPILRPIFIFSPIYVKMRKVCYKVSLFFSIFIKRNANFLRHRVTLFSHFRNLYNTCGSMLLLVVSNDSSYYKTSKI